MDRSRPLARPLARREARRDAPRDTGRDAAGGGRPAAPPASSRLTLRRPRNRRRAGSVWSRLPHTLVVELREHTAAAVAALGDGELYLIDAGGRPFKRAAIDAGEVDRLPLVTGLDRAAFAADPAAAEATLRAAIAMLDRWRA